MITLRLYIALLVFCAFRPAIAALQNITVLTTNDTLAQITYTGSWDRSATYGAYTYARANSLSSTATFTFTGVAVYYVPILVSSGASSTSNYIVSLTLDSNAPQQVSLLLPSGSSGMVPQVSETLANQSHTVVLTISQGGGTLYGYIYTIDTSSPTSSSLSSSSGSSPTGSSPSSSPSPISPSPISPSPPHKNNVGKVVAGSVVGGVAAIVLAVIAFLNLHHLTQLFQGLLFSLFGIFLFKGRRLIFKADKDLGPTEVTLLVTRDAFPSDFKTGDSERLVVWQVFKIGGAERDFSVTFPCSVRSGWPDVSVGTITDKGKLIECEDSEVMPAFLDNDGVWQREELVDEKTTRKTRPKMVARNKSELDARIALGTSDGTEMRPFLLIEDSIFKKDAAYEAEMDLFIHAFRSNGYAPGQVDDTILERVRGDRLTPEGGLKVSQLDPLTTWYLRSRGGGKLSLEIGRNRSKDIKTYQHECKINKKAPGTSEVSPAVA